MSPVRHGHREEATSSTLAKSRASPLDLRPSRTPVEAARWRRGRPGRTAHPGAGKRTLPSEGIVALSFGPKWCPTVSRARRKSQPRVVDNAISNRSRQQYNHFLAGKV
ncbi:uncharacterized protein VTP21DRAFT_9978 [Calcarisporiella thermophila]|uniref:uncharacterized protein n=1 Tax=Calcarisporiella thermophila TaxID=911321 RepID=UPI003743CB0B